MRLRKRRGSVIVEAAMMIPLLLYFFLGLVEFARVGYTYFTAQKMLYTFARFVGTRALSTSRSRSRSSVPRSAASR